MHPPSITRRTARVGTRLFCIITAALISAGCATHNGHQPAANHDLVGAWRSKLHFSSGALAEMKALEFMYVFNAGGTMTESSNYDAAPPVPPAYGVWRKIGPNRYEAKYAFYSTKAPSTFDEITKSGGWLPAGNGVLIEKIMLAADGKSFKSTIRYEAFEPDGQPAEGGGDGIGEAARIDF